MQRYPESTVINIDDFRRLNWKVIINSIDREGCQSMWQSLSSAARASVESGSNAEGKALWLLADACSMMLDPSSINEPFKPFMVMYGDGKRSVFPEDFQESDVALLAQFSEEVDDIWLQARLADLAWLLLKPRSPQYALLAIDAYRQISLETEIWISGGRECWERAVRLCKMLNAGAGERINEIEASILASFDSSKNEDGFLALWLADLLLANRLGHNKRLHIVEKLEVMARDFELAGDLHRARDFFDAAAKWFRQSGNKAKAAEMTACVAEGWVKEAIARMSSELPSYMAAASFYENAIQTYRSIPRNERATLRADDRMAEIHKQLNEAGARSLEEMCLITSPSVDINEMVEKARDSVRGKSAIDAIAAFSNIYRGVQVAQVQASSKKNLQQSITYRLFANTHISRDGRVVAKQSAADFSEAGSGGGDPALWAQMIRNYQILIDIVVQGKIWPALEVLVLEHRLREGDFVEITRNSPIVPNGRERLFGKALFAGYEKDFVTALHLLVPQIEHMVRWHLKASGIKTTNIDKDGIENENGLSTLVELPEVAQIFGDDLAFELKALFCDAIGANLRNELAHGLLGEEECNSIYSIYAWWLGLRIVFNTFWNKRQKPESNGAASQSN